MIQLPVASYQLPVKRYCVNIVFLNWELEGVPAVLVTGNFKRR